MTIPVTIIVIGLGTYLLRLSFVGVFGNREIPDWLERPLRYVAPSVLAAIVLPAVVLRDNAVDLMPGTNPKFLAAVVAALVAWKLKNVALVIVIGMGVLWMLQAWG